MSPGGAGPTSMATPAARVMSCPAPARPLHDCAPARPGRPGTAMRAANAHKQMMMRIVTHVTCEQVCTRPLLVAGLLSHTGGRQQPTAGPLTWSIHRHRLHAWLLALDDLMLDPPAGSGRRVAQPLPGTHRTQCSPGRRRALAWLKPLTWHVVTPESGSTPVASPPIRKSARCSLDPAHMRTARQQ